MYNKGQRTAADDFIPLPPTEPQRLIEIFAEVTVLKRSYLIKLTAFGY